MYQVWIQNEFNEEWTLTECETLADVKDAFLESLKQGQPTLVTQRLETSVEVKIKETPVVDQRPRPAREPKIRKERKPGGLDETATSGPPKDTDPGSESNGPV